MARIILVEDDDILAEIIVETLEAEGHMVSVIDDGDHAVAAVRESDPDMLILDYGLPGKTGYQILREVRTAQTAASMPIIILTARTGKLHRLEAERYGADDYIVKPVSTSNLVAKVEAMLLGQHIVRNVSRSLAVLEQSGQDGGQPN